MAREVFVDSSGLYALADHRDPAHPAARQCVHRLASGGVRLLLTDYILDEAATLAKARAGGMAALKLLEIVEQSDAFDMVWIGQERFEATKTFFRKHADHEYSFTDCTSFVVMRELKIREALTTDRHFAEAGFHPLLPLA
ncbi:MAG: type II toxin-antitoxin system VapC family toxin [Verrucomicrobia bacterium]|nr:type II toxin-antitoxin system VapC family toxin [Verrucomicrobiota bacterium]